MKEDFDDREEVFLLDGFDALSEKYQQKILKINAIPNSNTDGESSNKFVTFKESSLDGYKNRLSSIIKTPPPGSIHFNCSFTSTIPN